MGGGGGDTRRKSWNGVSIRENERDNTGRYFPKF